MVLNYQEKLELKKERYLNLMNKNLNLAKINSCENVLGEKNTRIPFGQPILVGHHSEKRHRKHLERIDNQLKRGFESQNKANYYKDKLNNLENNYNISSDDDKSVIKLKERLEKFEKHREQIKKYNKEQKQKKEEILPAYHLQNLNQKIRNTKIRIEHLEKIQNQTNKEHIIKDIKIIENYEENRLQIHFNYIPIEEIRIKLKRYGFKWSFYNKCWQRFISSDNTYYINKIKELV